LTWRMHEGKGTLAEHSAPNRGKNEGLRRENEQDESIT
jgi:hypothetical protein